MAEYRTFTGVVSFDPRVNDNAGGKRVKNVLIRLANSVDNTSVDLALWEEMADVEVTQGDFVIAEGAYKTEAYNGEDRHKLSVTRIAVLNPQTGASKPSNGSAPTTPVAKKDRKVSY